MHLDTPPAHDDFAPDRPRWAKIPGRLSVPEAAKRDSPDRIAREHAGGRLLMALRHPVDIAAEVEREARHVERVVAAETPQSRGIDKVPEQAANQIVIEPVMARVDQSMG